MNKPAISVCVVAKNAAQTTKRLFDSLKEFADRGGDMVLVDTGSTDETKTLYAAFGFRVFDVGDRFDIKVEKDVAEFINAEAAAVGEPPIVKEGDRLFHFADARNFAAAQAVNDYIANPDADEELTVFNIDKIELFFQAASRFTYEFVFSHKADGSAHHAFRTDTRFSDRRHWRWKGVVHETLEPLTENPKTVYVPPDVLKIEHYQVPSETRGSYLTGLAYACHIQPENDRNLHYYARELHYRGWPKLALTKFQKHLELSKWDLEKAQSLIFMGDICINAKDDAKAIEHWRKAIEMAPQRRDPWLKLAHYYFTHSRPHETIACAAAALALPPVVFYGNVADGHTFLPHHYLYWGYHKIGDIEKARDHWMMALSYDPKNQAFQYDSIYFRRI